MNLGQNTMSPRPLHFVEVATAALAGPATVLAASSSTGRVVAGDDRGEVGLWDASGERLLTLRLDGPICDADVTPAGERVAVRSASGELVVADVKGQRLLERRLPAAGLLRLDATGDAVVCLDPATGYVEVLQVSGKRVGGFDVPWPIAGAVVHPRDQGLLVVTPRGLLTRFTAWGEQVWAADLAKYTGALAIDHRGTLLVVVGFGRGAEGVLPERGTPAGSFDAGRSVEAAAVSRHHVLLGTSDRQLLLVERTAETVADTRLSARPFTVCLRDDSRHAAARLDDGTVRLFHLTTHPSDEPVRAPIAGAAPEGAFPPREAFTRRLFAPGTLLRPSFVALSPCGNTLAVTGEGRRVFLLRRDGSIAQDEHHDGQPLALEIDAKETAHLVTTRELRSIATAGSRVGRTFGIDLGKARFATDRATLAVADELGIVQRLDAQSGERLRSFEVGPQDPPRALCAAPGRIAWQRRTGGIDVDGGVDGAGGAVHVTGNWSAHDAPRLLALGRDGPFVAAAQGLVAFGWDGAERWRRPVTGTITAIVTGAEGTIVCATPAETVHLSADGATLAAFRTPAGRLTCAAPEEDGFVLAFVDGRRLVVVDIGGRTLWHTTLREDVHAMAMTRGGRSLALVAGDGVLLLETTPPAAREESDPDGASA